jgi:hypothetical protein
MPPNSQASIAGRNIIVPGDQLKRDGDTGLITSFGKFNIFSDSRDILENTGVTIGIYAAGGTGKTTFFCGIADRKLNPEGFDLPLLLLDAMAGIKSVAHLIGPDLQQLPIHSFTDIEEWIGTARAHPRSSFPWRSVYLDNLTDLMHKALAEQGFHNVGKGSGLTSSQPDFNAMTTRITVALQDLKDLSQDYNFNLFVSLWDQVDKTPDGVTLGVKAALTPQLSTRVQGILDYIGYMSVMPSKTVVNGQSVWVRKLDFSANPAQDTKWRVTPDKRGEVPEELYQPQLLPILNTVKRGIPIPTRQFAYPTRASGTA